VDIQKMAKEGDGSCFRSWAAYMNHQLAQKDSPLGMIHDRKVETVMMKKLGSLKG